MPTQIPVEPARSWMVGAEAALLLSLLAAAINSAVVFIIIWVYG